jgi:hypothetical protein
MAAPGASIHIYGMTSCQQYDEYADHFIELVLQHIARCNTMWHVGSGSRD